MRMKVKHFLLIGSLGMFLGACVFLYLSFTRAKSSLAHTVTFHIVFDPSRCLTRKLAHLPGCCHRLHGLLCHVDWHWSRVSHDPGFLCLVLTRFGLDRLKTTDLSPRVIFLSRYVDALLTQPVTW